LRRLNFGTRPETTEASWLVVVDVAQFSYNGPPITDIQVDVSIMIMLHAHIHEKNYRNLPTRSPPQCSELRADFDVLGRGGLDKQMILKQPDQIRGTEYFYAQYNIEFRSYYNEMSR
jgi:hypothetical protein